MPQPMERSAFPCQTLWRGLLTQAKKNRVPEGTRLGESCFDWTLYLRFAVLQDFNRLAQLFVLLRRLRLVLLGGRVCVLILVRSHAVVVAVSHQNVRRNRRVRNRLPTRRVVFRDGENQGRAVRKVDQLLHGAIAEGLVSDNVAARI